MTDINVLSRTQRIVVDPHTSTIAIINAGPQGPGGPAGVGAGISVEEAIDAVAAALQEGVGMTIVYNDSAGTITLSSTGGSGGGGITLENAVDAVAAALLAGTHTGITVFYDDVGNAIDLTATGLTTESAVDAVAAAFAAGSHTGVTVTYNDGANSLSLAASGSGYTNEEAVDAVAAAFAAGTHTNVTVTYNDGAGSISLAASGGGGGGITVEDAIDAVAAALTAGNNIDITYNDTAGTITIDVETLTSADVGLGNVNNTSDVNKPISTATQTALDLKAPVRRVINAQTGTTYQPVIADENKMVTLSNAAAITVTLPSNATEAIPVNAEIEFVWLGTGQPSFVAGSGATATGTPGLKLRDQGSACAAKKVSTNGWLLYGDLAP